MKETTNIIDQTYAEMFEEELTGLKRRMENDASCTIADLQGTLNNLYIMDGNNWTGRGELQAAILNATIAAYEYFITESKLEKA